MYYNKNNQDDNKEIISLEKSYYELLINGNNDGILIGTALVDRGYTMKELEEKLFISNALLLGDFIPIIDKKEQNAWVAIINSFNRINVIITLSLISFALLPRFKEENSEGSYKLVATQPFLRYKLLFSKFLVTSSFGILSYLISLSITFITGFIMGGLGDRLYPIATRDSVHFISLNPLSTYPSIISSAKYLTYGALLFISIFLALTSLTMLVTVISTKSKSVIALFATVIFLSVILNVFIKQTAVNLFFPFAYIFIDNTLSVSTNSNFGLGLIINLSMSFLLIIISAIVYTRTDLFDALD